MIRVDIAAKSFGSAQVLRDVRFEVNTGETVAILGPSGVGKSTLLNLIAATDLDYEGQISTPQKKAIVFQEPTLMPWRSVSQNISLIHPKADVRQALAKVGLGNKGDLFPGQLSLGQQRRLALARAFADPPEMLIMDEPFVSLDADTLEEMLVLTEALIHETKPTTIFVTHSQSEAQRLATRVLHLGGSPATITTRS